MNALPALLSSSVTFHELTCVSVKKLINALENKEWIAVLQDSREIMLPDNTTIVLDNHFGKTQYSKDDEKFFMDEKAMMNEEEFTSENIETDRQEHKEEEDEDDEEEEDDDAADEAYTGLVKKKSAVEDQTVSTPKSVAKKKTAAQTEKKAAPTEQKKSVAQKSNVSMSIPNPNSSANIVKTPNSELANMNMNTMDVKTN